MKAGERPQPVLAAWRCITMAFMAVLPEQFTLDDLQVNLGQQRVARAGAFLQVPRLSFDVLVALAKASPNLVSIDELMSEVWPGIVVNPETVAQRIKLLRDALGDDPREPRYIESLRGRGYRLLPQVAPAAAPQGSSAPTPAIPPAVSEPKSWPNRRRVAFALLAVALAFVALAVTRALWPRVSTPVAADGAVRHDDSPLPPHAVAILPFATIGGDPSDAVIASGIAETIRLRLATLSQIVVIADESVAKYGSKINANTVGRELNARYLLGGTLQRQTDTLRITARMVDAQNNAVLWSVLFDRKVSDIFSVQDEISVKVARALNLSLDSEEELRLEGGGTNNLDAYLEVLEARNLLTVGTPADVRQAVNHFRRATQLDANYSAAYSGLAMAMVVSAYFGEEHLTDAQSKSAEAEIRKINQKALELDPRNAASYMVLVYLEADPAKQDTYVKRVLALEPNSARAHAMFASLEIGHVDAGTSPTLFDDKIIHLKKAMEIDPLNPTYPALLASEYFYHRTVEIERVEPLLQRSLELDANFSPARETLALLRMCKQRRYAEGIKIMEGMVAQAPSSTYYRDMLAFAYAGMGDLAAAEDVAADSKYRSSLVIALAARHRWREASKIFSNTDDVFEDVFSLTSYMTALRLEAHESGSYAKARNFFEHYADINWGSNGAPVIGIPMTALPLTREIALADVLQNTGETSRAAKILQASLDAAQTAAVKLKRGDLWLRFARIQALTLLGRDSEALDILAQMDPGAGVFNDWRQFAVDPSVDRIRHAPKFVAFLEASEQYDAAQRALVQTMRQNGEIPKRPMHQKL